MIRFIDNECINMSVEILKKHVAIPCVRYAMRDAMSEIGKRANLNF